MTKPLRSLVPASPAVRAALASCMLAFVAVASVGCAHTAAQPEAAAQNLRPFAIAHSQIVPIASKHTGRQHELVVILPPDYAAHPDKNYPVLYFLDAYWDAPLVSAVYGNLRYDNAIPEMILVGLSYPSGANYDRERLLDYTPSAEGAGSGGGKAFLEFIRTEAAPLIEARYRGASTERILAGSSLGGLFSIASAYMAPDFFAAHIAISPAAMWDKEVMFRMDEAFAQSGKPLASRMFISSGSSEYKLFREPIERFGQQLAKRPYGALALQTYVMQDIDHAGVKGDGYTRGLIWAWKNRKPAGPSGLERGLTGK